MSIDAVKFRSVLSRFASGITIVSITDESGADLGMTVSAFCSVSLEPPMILVCIANDATMAPAMATASNFAVSILANSQEELSRRFASQIENRFDGVGFHRAASGCALIDDAVAWLDCSVTSRHPEGDHVIVVGEVQAATWTDGDPLLYYRSGYSRIAH